jgi:hypothetical protein
MNVLAPMPKYPIYTRLPDPRDRYDYEYITPLRNTPDASIPPSANSHSIENRKAQTHAKTHATSLLLAAHTGHVQRSKNEHTSPKNKQTLPKKRPHIAKQRAPHTRPPSSAAVQRRCAGGGGLDGGGLDGGGDPHAQEDDPPPLGLTPDPLGVPLS